MNKEIKDSNTIKQMDEDQLKENLRLLRGGYTIEEAIKIIDETRDELTRLEFDKHNYDLDVKLHYVQCLLRRLEKQKVAKETKIVYWCPYGKHYLNARCEGKGESICVPDSSKDCNKEFLIEEK